MQIAINIADSFKNALESSPELFEGVLLEPNTLTILFDNHKMTKHINPKIFIALQSYKYNHWQVKENILILHYEKQDTEFYAESNMVLLHD